jgi:hypothetical protein
MTGPEHYREAERLLAEEVFIDRSGAQVHRTYAETVAAAQVHATLAVAAATALGTSGTEGRAWAGAAGSRLSGGSAEPGPRH